jgi:hypothetical protein
VQVEIDNQHRAPAAALVPTLEKERVDVRFEKPRRASTTPWSR